MTELPPTDEIRMRMAVEFELYFSELIVIAAESVNMTASAFLDNIEANRSILISAQDFKELSRETFLHGFSSGVLFMEEQD